MKTDKKARRRQRRGVRIPSIAQLERLKYLESLPDDAVVRTPDAALLAGIGGSTWERRRMLGQTPEPIWLNGSALGFRKGDIIRHRAEHVKARRAAA